MENSKTNLNLFGIAFVIGMLILGTSLIFMVRNLKSYDRYVTVKGLCEKEVMADKVIWPIMYKLGGDEMEVIYQSVQQKNRQIVKFLNDAGIPDEEITINAPSIVDTRIDSYHESKYNYIVTAGVTVCSEKIESIVKLQTESGKLYAHGIPLLSENWSYPTIYSFNGLNEIKPAMIEEATVNARLAAEKFAKDSNSRLGKIKNATQGQFTISDRDVNTPYIKNIRVVTNVVYYLKD